MSIPNPMIISASLLMKLGSAEKAEEIYRDLVKRNPENSSYYEGIEYCLAAKSPTGTCESKYEFW